VQGGPSIEIWLGCALQSCSRRQPAPARLAGCCGVMAAESPAPQHACGAKRRRDGADCRSNATLSEEERRAKKQAKKQAKAEHRAARQQRRLLTLARLGHPAAAAATASSAPACHGTARSSEGGADEGKLASLRDDMGRVYSLECPAQLAAAARAGIGAVTQRFAEQPAYAADPRAAQAGALALLNKMKKGTQGATDFASAGEGALWQYARLKWSARSMLCFECLRQAHRQAAARAPHTASRGNISPVLIS
jgi:hypothetical protein